MQYRKTNKIIGVEKYDIGNKLRRLLEDTIYWIENKTFDEDVFRGLHHRSVQIHMFPNDNGRHSRLMTDVLLQDVSIKAIVLLMANCSLRVK